MEWIDFRVFESSLMALNGDRMMTRMQKIALKEIVLKYGPNPINKTLGELAEEFGYGTTFMDLASKAWRRAGMFYKLKKGGWAVPEFFWWIPSPGVNEQTALSRYTSRVSKLMRDNGRRRAAGVKDWKEGLNGCEEVEEVGETE